MWKRLAPALALALLPAVSEAREAPGGHGRHGGAHRTYADPGAVLAAELAFSRLAQDKGQWTAFRTTAAPGAEMFVPQRVLAVDWLKHRADPAVPVRWQAYDVWSSCDGSHAVTRGRWERPGASGTFVTVWQRQPKGGYKWLLDMSLDDERSEPAPEMVAGKVADCGRGSAQPAMPALLGSPDGQGIKRGAASDGTLDWLSRAGADGRRRFTARMWNGKTFETIIDIGDAGLAR